MNSKKMMWWVGPSLLLIGCVHNALGLVEGWAPCSAALDDGYIGAWQGMDRQAVLWFLTCGVAIWGIAVAAWPLGRPGSSRGPARALGILLLVTAIAGGLAMPASGFWSLLAPGVLLVGGAARGDA